MPGAADGTSTVCGGHLRDLEDGYLVSVVFGLDFLRFVEDGNIRSANFIVFIKCQCVSRSCLDAHIISILSVEVKRANCLMSNVTETDSLPQIRMLP